MFDKDFSFVGKHANYVKQLVYDKQLPERPFIFERYIDVYMNAAIWGLLYGRKSKRDNTTSDRGNILAGAFSTERETCVFLYRLVMLLESSRNLSPEEHVSCAFRDDSLDDNQKKLSSNMDIFHSYVLGGVEVLYETYSEGCFTQDDYINRIYNIMDSFDKEMAEFSYDEKLTRMISG